MEDYVHRLRLLPVQSSTSPTKTTLTRGSETCWGRWSRDPAASSGAWRIKLRRTHLRLPEIAVRVVYRAAIFQGRPREAPLASSSPCRADSEAHPPLAALYARRLSEGCRIAVLVAEGGLNRSNFGPGGEQPRWRSRIRCQSKAERNRFTPALSVTSLAGLGARPGGSACWHEGHDGDGYFHMPSKEGAGGASCRGRPRLTGEVQYCTTVWRLGETIAAAVPFSLSRTLPYSVGSYRTAPPGQSGTGRRLPRLAEDNGKWGGANRRHVQGPTVTNCDGMSKAETQCPRRLCGGKSIYGNGAPVFISGGQGRSASRIRRVKSEGRKSTVVSRRSGVESPLAAGADAIGNAKKGRGVITGPSRATAPPQAPRDPSTRPGR